jgi:ferredoxin
MEPRSTTDFRRLSRAALGALLTALREHGYTLIGPTLHEQAIVYAEIASLDDLPQGWTDAQDAGRYRVERRGDDALFGYAVGPRSFKPWFLVPRLQLFRIHRTPHGFVTDTAHAPAPKLALIGARGCDLHAIEILDRTLMHGPHPDPDYVERRQNVFVVAVNCGQAGGTCFCTSMGTGPNATRGFDLAMTEVMEGDQRFVVEVGTEKGRNLLAHLEPPCSPASAADLAAVDALVDRTARSMGRTLDTTDIRNLLYANADHPRWDDVAARCLSCTNCTMVCPTCFCGSTEDTTDLSGEAAERWRRWDSCFTADHSYVHGGSVRASTRSRYRQWLTHKLASWIDQFGSSGCVGCGRCITWCPAGIDITEEVAAIRAADGVYREEASHGVA